MLANLNLVLSGENALDALKISDDSIFVVLVPLVIFE